MLRPLPAWISGKRGRWQAGALGSSGAKGCTEGETEVLRGDGFSVGTKWLASGARTRRERPPGGSLCTVPGRWRTGTGRGLVWDPLGAAAAGSLGLLVPGRRWPLYHWLGFPWWRGCGVGREASLFLRRTW